MSAALTAGLAGLLGLLIGSFLNVVVHRVPRGESVVSPPSACPRCGTPIRNRHNVPVLGWLLLRGRCYDCAAPISARYPVVELATAALFVIMALRFADDRWALPAYLVFAAAALALALIDLDVHRLPDAIVLPAYPLVVVLLAADHDGPDLLRAAIGCTVLFTFYLALAVAAPGAMGGGDVKLAGLVGLMTAYVSWGTFLTGAFLAFILGAVAGVALMAAGRAGRRTAVPFGPFMLLGALSSVLGAGYLGDYYLTLIGA
ncbi:A24 family peptidase [Nocardioides sp. MH1]|uniref:prepilin peptidase n=1 Tax=Nocardioides sp. MH1 TaxID=3242490 RepID=UPI003521FBF0